MSDTAEFLSPAIVDRITDLRKRLEGATTEVTALVDAIEPPNGEVKRQVQLCLREVAINLERALDQAEVTESAAVGMFEPTD